MNEQKKMTLKQVDIMMCYLCNEGTPIAQVDIFYRNGRNHQGRDAEPKLLHQVHDNFISEEHCIPDFILTGYGKCPVSMWQLKYTGANRLVGRIIIDASFAKRKKSGKNKNRNVKPKRPNRAEQCRVQEILHNQEIGNNLDGIINETALDNSLNSDPLGWKDPALGMPVSRKCEYMGLEKNPEKHELSCFVKNPTITKSKNLTKEPETSPTKYKDEQ